MNEAAKEAFTMYFAEPVKLASFFSLAIFACLIIVVMKTFRNGAKERQDDENFHDSDYLTAILRVLLVLLILMVFFGF